jgi:hypothetical protein
MQLRVVTAVRQQSLDVIGETTSARSAGTVAVAGWWGGVGVPASHVSAVVLNVTVVGAMSPGFLTVFPSGVSRPNPSNLNFPPDQTVPNLVTKVGADGEVSIFNAAGVTHVIADVVGWFPICATISLHPTPDVTPSSLRSRKVGHRVCWEATRRRCQSTMVVDVTNTRVSIVSTTGALISSAPFIE